MSQEEMKGRFNYRGLLDDRHRSKDEKVRKPNIKMNRVARLEFIRDNVFLVQPISTEAADDDFETFMKDISEVWIQTEAKGGKFFFVFDSTNFTPSVQQVFSFARLFIDVRAISDRILLKTYLIFPDNYRMYLDLFLSVYTPQKPVQHVESLEEALKEIGQ